MSTEEKQIWIPLATAAARIPMDAEELRRLCGPGGSPIAHGADINGAYYVWDRTVRLLKEKQE